MENSKLIQLIRTFSKTEINDFGKFIRSPFFNESPKLVLLYELIADNYPEFLPGKFNKEVIFGMLYPDEKKYDDKKIRSRFNIMLQLAEEFLSQVELKKDNNVSGRLALSQLASRKLEVHFKRKFLRLNEEIEESVIINNEYFHERYLMIKAKRNFYGFTKPVGKREEYYKDFSEEAELFIKYSVIKLIKYYVIMKCDQDYLNYSFDFSFLKKVLEYIEEKKYTEYPIFEIFRSLLQLEEKFLDEELFDKTKLLFYKHIPSIDKEDAILILNELYNLATRYFYGGEFRFVKVPFELVEQMVKHDIYPVENGFMAERQYLDTVYTALAAAENDWAEWFVNDFKLKLNPEVRNNAYNYSISLIEMTRENYDKALEGFARVRVDDFYYYMRIKYNRFRIYFERGDFEPIFSEIDAFRHYLSINKMIPEDIRTNAAKFLNFFNKLVKAKVNNNYEEIESLNKILQDSDMEMKRTLQLIISRILKQKPN